MKLMVLTTETLHHIYFVKQLYMVHQRDAYESDLFFKGKNIKLKDVAETKNVDSVNSDKSINLIKKYSPDIIIVGGTGKIYKDVIKSSNHGTINLHGGDPEQYRGLDSHLWSIYHNDFNNFIITIHHVNEELDDGDIILQKEIRLTKNMKIHELRSYNIQIVVELAISNLDMYKRHGFFISRPQRKKGRYYSFMPSSLKDICVKRFNKYTLNI